MPYSSKVWLGALTLFLSIQLPIFAQTPTPDTYQQDSVSPVPAFDLRPVPVELPDIEPILPAIQETHLVLKLRERRVYVYQGDKVEASYPVAIGRPGWETPTGRFQVLAMVQNPGWTNPFTREVIPPGPNNPLGERWIAFWTDGSSYVGFHGTPNRETVGRAASHGCIRMFNEDVRKLYSLVKVGTPVVVER